MIGNKNPSLRQTFLTTLKIVVFIISNSRLGNIRYIGLYFHTIDNCAKSSMLHNTSMLLYPFIFKPIRSGKYVVFFPSVKPIPHLPSMKILVVSLAGISIPKPN